MSRSFKKYPFVNGGRSKRWGRKHSSRLLRHKVKQLLDKRQTEILPLPEELYDFAWDNDSGCDFDKKEFPELMRK